ncbi:MAG TPA: DUF4832 domain-containing protein [Kofleriaceae bacterium]|nr:DUF4832 domain-containing protein [Kofleriaceae bacterium]
MTSSLAKTWPVLACLASGCSHGPSSDGVDAAVVVEPALVETTFTEDPANVLAPERGFYTGIDLLGGSDFASVRAGGMTLAIASIHLDSYRTTALDPNLLDGLSAGFMRVRAAGIKVILRFSYNDGPNGAPDASLAQIEAHIAQLAPILRANADVIAFMQAGFIGAWGEWHDSTNGLDTTPNRLAIISALLDALPANRMVQVRTPGFVDAMFPGGPLDPAQGFSGTPRSRVGHHNDCFLASPTDYGTYADPVETWKDYIAADSRFTPMGGETCNVDAPRSDCESATAEMARLHMTYVNSQYHQGVLDGWTTQGCMPAIQKRLGYRLVLESARHSEQVKPGGRLRLEIALRNDGFASPLNVRPLRVVLDRGSERYVVTLANVDVRRWEAGEHQVATTLRIPSELAAGTYRVSLWLPDADLETRPEYAIAFANTDVFDATAGLDVIVPALVVDPNAPGEAIGDAHELVELP